MNKLIVFLLSFIAICPGHAASLPEVLLQRKVASQVNKLEKLTRAAKCLHEGRQFCHSISWQQAFMFIDRNDKKSSSRKAQVNKYVQLRKALPVKNQTRKLPYSTKQENLVFRQAANFKFIFVGEYHLEGVRPAVTRLLKTIRQQHPSSRILLASEFAITFAPLQALPFQTAQGKNKAFAPLTSNFSVVFDAAKQLNMDILSLDDMWLEMPKTSTEKWRFPTKVGDFLVEADQDNPEVYQLVSYAYGAGASKDPLAIVSRLRAFFLATPWGVNQRNLQWANYLSAMKDSYDIIIVYGGRGHFDHLESTLAVPQRLNLKQYAFIELNKIPTAQEQAFVNQETQRRGYNAAAPKLATQAGITYRWKPSVQAQFTAQERNTLASQLRPLMEQEKQLGFDGTSALNVEIILPK